ncbi:hypothetical protein DITRI_Ditri01bG0170600 [Diplodiscus trichospermus]
MGLSVISQKNGHMVSEPKIGADGSEPSILEEEAEAEDSRDSECGELLYDVAFLSDDDEEVREARENIRVWCRSKVNPSSGNHTTEVVLSDKDQRIEASPSNDAQPNRLGVEKGKQPLKKNRRRPLPPDVEIDHNIEQAGSEVEYDCSEPSSYESEADDNGEEVETLRKKRFCYYNPKSLIPDLEVGMLFDDNTQFKEAMIDYSAHTKKDIWYAKNEPKRVTIYQCLDSDVIAVLQSYKDEDIRRMSLSTQVSWACNDGTSFVVAGAGGHHTEVLSVVGADGICRHPILFGIVRVQLKFLRSVPIWYRFSII